jgi:hypothetical protein
MASCGSVDPEGLRSDQVYFYFSLPAILGVNSHFQAPSDGGQADVQRSRRTPGQGGVRSPIAYLSEAADFLEHFRYVDSAGHKSTTGSFCAIIRSKSGLAACAGSGLVISPNDTSAYYLR